MIRDIFAYANIYTMLCNKLKELVSHEYGKYKE